MSPIVRPLALVAVLLAGCVTRDDELASLDRDGDGWYHEAASELGEEGPFDCDDDDAAVSEPALFYGDDDGDGFGNPALEQLACSAPLGYVDTSTDCDDSSDAVSPAAEETCNGQDDDCDGESDESGTFVTWFPDGDGDGYGIESGVVQACAPPDGYASKGGDCEDEDDAVSPGSEEVCNGQDDDCDDDVDEDIAIATFYGDADSDGYGGAAETTTGCAAPSGYVANQDDCDDSNADIQPGATEVCNLVDDDCDDTVDEGFTASVWYADSDGDGYGSSSVTVVACMAPAGHVADNTDCDDASNEAFPGHCEGGTSLCQYACTDLLDNDCDGYTDSADSRCVP